VRFVQERFGDAGLQHVLDMLPAESRQLIRGRKILPHEWIGYDVFVDFNVATDKLFGKGDLQLCVEMGRFSARVNLPTLYRLFYRFGSPVYIFRKAAQVWSVHYDSGRIRVTDEGQGRVKLHIEQFDKPHRAHCLSVLGWAAGSIELSGGTLTLADETACRTKGADACELTLHYRD
jgi:hypothetical protein